MIVRIRFGRGKLVSGRAGNNRRIAQLTATLLTLAAISMGSFGLWRIGGDLGWAGDFVFTTGILSHWQIWIGAAIAGQYAAWQLTSYARRATRPKAGEEDAEDSPVAAVSNV
jgi:hypothetical protein